jgi:hypothetical protein
MPDDLLPGGQRGEREIGAGHLLATSDTTLAVFEDHECRNHYDYAWNQQLNGSNPELVRAFQEAAAQPMLRQLFPLTSHHTVRFSRVTGFPYTMDLPYIEALGDSVYVARRASPSMLTPGDMLVRGTIFEATTAILEVLPQDLAPARNGTAKD